MRRPLLRKLKHEGYIPRVLALGNPPAPTYNLSGLGKTRTAKKEYTLTLNHTIHQITT